MRARVPCHTSGFVLILVAQRSIAGLLWENNRGSEYDPANGSDGLTRFADVPGRP
jgi:hypothetical protein